MQDTYPLVNTYNNYLNTMSLNEQQFEEYIQELSFSIKNKKMTPLFEKSKKAYDNNIKIIKRILGDYGINVKELETKAHKLGNSIKSDLKNNNEKSITKKIADVITECIKHANESLNNITDSKVLRSLILFINLFVIGGCLSVPFTVISPQIGMIICGVIIAPITEEIAKNISLEGNYPWVYTGIFSGLEFIQYVIVLLLSGASLSAAFIIRAIGVIMHFSTLMIQKYFKEKGDKINDNTKNIIGMYIGITIHVIFNVLSITFNKKLLAIAGIH